VTQTAAGRLLSRPMSHLLCQGCSRDLGDQTWTGACPYCGATRVMRVGDSDQALTGRVVAGRFRIVRKLGQGGMGRVFLAEQLELGQHVALQFLNVGISRDVAPALSGLYWPRLRVELFANPESVTPERVQLIANSIMKLLESVPGAKPRLIAVDAIEIADVPAGRILVGLLAPAGPELRLLSFLVAGKEHDALLSFDTSAEQFDGLQPLLEAAAADTQPRSSEPSH